MFLFQKVSARISMDCGVWQATPLLIKMDLETISSRKRPKGFVGILEIRHAFKQQKELNRIIVIVNNGRKELTRRLNS